MTKHKTKKPKILRTLIVLFILLCIISIFYKPSSGKVVELSEIPNLEIPIGFNDQYIVEHDGYTLSYAEEFEQSYWVAYKLSRNQLYGDIDRTDDFREDPSIKTGSAELSDYRGSGYDRGHLCSSADQKGSLSSQSDTFYMSNMSPQNPSFNRGIWKETEETVRNFADTENLVYVVTGPILTDGPYKTIGANEVAVPNYYYKAILKYDGENSKAIAFLMENKKLSGDPEDYVFSIDEIEKVSDIDFFPSLPDDIEDRIEANYDKSLWNFDKFSISSGLGPTENTTTITITNYTLLDKIMLPLQSMTLSILAKLNII